MLRIYRCLLYLYPAAHREQFGDEMTAVFREVQAATKQQGIAARVSCAYARPQGSWPAHCINMSES